MFGLTDCANLPCMLLTGIPSIPETGEHIKITCIIFSLSSCIDPPLHNGQRFIAHIMGI